jgi:hypothetical protein
MIWTTQAPIMEGWYWFRGLDGNDERIVAVYKEPTGRLAASGENFDLFNLAGHQWAGPIERNAMSDPEWTTENPSKPGWYWYRLRTQDTNPAMAHVCEFGGHLNAVWSNGKSVYVRDIPGEWAGPLEPPA